MLSSETYEKGLLGASGIQNCVTTVAAVLEGRWLRSVIPETDPLYTVPLYLSGDRRGGGSCQLGAGRALSGRQSKREGGSVWLDLSFGRAAASLGTILSRAHPLLGGLGGVHGAPGIKPGLAPCEASRLTHQPDPVLAGNPLLLPPVPVSLPGMLRISLGRGRVSVVARVCPAVCQGWATACRHPCCLGRLRLACLVELASLAFDAVTAELAPSLEGDSCTLPCSLAGSVTGSSEKVALVGWCCEVELVCEAEVTHTCLRPQVLLLVAPLCLPHDSHKSAGVWHKVCGRYLTFDDLPVDTQGPSEVRN